MLGILFPYAFQLFCSAMALMIFITVFFISADRNNEFKNAYWNG